MAKAGSAYGMQLLWVLFLSCLFSWVLMGSLRPLCGGHRRHGHPQLPHPLPLWPRHRHRHATGIVIGPWVALSGLTNLCANALYEAFRMLFPTLPESSYPAILGIAIAILGTIYAFLLVGRYAFFERILVVFVSIMGLAFLISMFVVLPSPKRSRPVSSRAFRMCPAPT